MKIRWNNEWIDIAGVPEVFVEDPEDPGNYLHSKIYIGEIDPGVGGDNPYVWLQPSEISGVIPIQFTKPTHNATRASSTLGSLSTPWSDSITTTTTLPSVRYAIQLSSQGDSNSVHYAALVCDGTIVDRMAYYNAGDGSRQNSGTIVGVHTPSIGSHTYEVYMAIHSGTLTISSTPSTSTAADLTGDGVSSMQLQLTVTG